MKNKIEILMFIIGIFFSIFIWHSIYAQDDSEIEQLSQEYILRLDSEKAGFERIDTSNATVINPDQVAKSAIEDSIETVNKTVEEVNLEKERTIIEIKESVKQDIDSAIIDIRQKTEKPAFELQKSVDSDRTILFDKMTQTINSIKPTGEKLESIDSSFKNDDEKIDDLETDIHESLQKIQGNLEEESGIDVNFEKSNRDISETLLKFAKIIEEKKVIIDSRDGDLVFKDSDNDNVSDYDEIYLYKTNPNNPKTKGDSKNDGEKINEGINPLGDNNEKINYQDPRSDRESFVSPTYKLDKVQLIKEDKEKLVFEGSALPNSFITLYIYSTPIIVTVKTGENGEWKYQLEQELENGEHQMYVANVDSSGKIIARSNPILFTKSAEAATIGITGSLDTSISTQNFLKDNFILITLAVLISVVVLGMMFVGNHKNIASAVTELKRSVNSK